MSHQILVPLDGSPFAEKALPLAMDLAHLHNAELILLRVVSHDSRLSDAEDYLRTETEKVTRNRIECRHEVVMGDPATTIVKRSEDSYMIVMASHGHSHHHTFILGCVTQEVMRTAHAPVLVVKNKARRLSSIHRILVPLDGFPLSREALAPAVEIAQKNEAELVLTRISDHPGFHIGTLSKEDESRKVQEFFDEVESNLPDKLRVERVHGFGSPARFLLNQLEASKIDLVVMTSHGRGGFKRWLCGSVAENLVRGSEVPLLVLRPDGPDAS